MIAKLSLVLKNTSLVSLMKNDHAETMLVSSYQIINLETQRAKHHCSNFPGLTLEYEGSRMVSFQ